MKKKKYEYADLEIVTFSGNDIITISNIDYEDEETPLMTED